MKFTFATFVPLMLVACAAQGSDSQPDMAASAPVAVATAKLADVDQAGPAGPEKVLAASIPDHQAGPNPPTKVAEVLGDVDAKLAEGAKKISDAAALAAAESELVAAPAKETEETVEAVKEAMEETLKAVAQDPVPAAPVAPVAPGNPVQVPTVKAPPVFQMPPAAPLPLPVVLGPDTQVDPHTLSGTNLGGPITVHGTTISEGELRRYICYAIGGKQLESMKYGVICDQEIAKRRAAGEDVSGLVVTDKEFDKAIEATRKDFLLKYPSLDFPIEVGRAFLSLDIYKIELRRTMLFDKVFFPQDPAKWPAVTTEAIILASNGRAFVDDAFESYASRVQYQKDQNLEELPPEDPILVDTLRSWLLESLNMFSQTETDVAKLPADALLIVDGVAINVDTLWTLVAPYVTWENVADARRFLTQIAVVEHDLAQRGVLLSQDEFEQAFASGGTFKDALAQYEMVAILLYGFPSMHANLRYERAMRSYRKMIAEELASDQGIAGFMQRANQIAGAARIDAEVILAGAYDFANARWNQPDGWKAAESKARELKKQLDAGADWGETLELHSDFWDPPMPEVGQKPQFGFNFKGRFGVQTRNQFLGDLHESEFTTFLRGKSIADEVFFDQVGGTISDVMKGRRGYYIARINSRTPGGSGLNLQVPQNREFAVNFVAMLKFGIFARQALTDALAAGKVTGF